MQVDPYLHYDGNCEAAFKFYEKELGAKVEAIMRYADAPPEMPTTPESKNKVMHGRISIDGAVVMGSDSPPGHFQKPQGFALTLTVDDPAEAERKLIRCARAAPFTCPGPRPSSPRALEWASTSSASP